MTLTTYHKKDLVESLQRLFFKCQNCALFSFTVPNGSKAFLPCGTAELKIDILCGGQEMIFDFMKSYNLPIICYD